MESPLLTKCEHIVDITSRGNSSSIDQPPHEVVERIHPYAAERFWNPVEFFLTLGQIVAATIILIKRRDEERPQTLLFIWIIGYTCGCIAFLPLLCWRFWYYDKSYKAESTEAYPRWTRVNVVMDTLRTVLEGFFVGWFVVFIWSLMYDPFLLDDATTQFFWLMTALLSFSFIRYVLPNLKCAIYCFMSPMLLCATPFVFLVAGMVMLLGEFLKCICP